MKHGLNTDKRIFCHLGRLLGQITKTCFIKKSKSVFPPCSIRGQFKYYDFDLVQ